MATKEAAVLRQRLFKLESVVDEILRAEFGRKLFRLSATDKLRLFRLITWRDRYKVPISFILKTLVPYYAEKFKRFSTRTDSLGCKISTLLGKKSEVMLRDAIARIYPNDEHIELWNQEQQLEILAIELQNEDEDELVTRPKNMLHFEHPDQYIASYSRRVNLKRKELQMLWEDETRRHRPWRGNPFT